jgi:hypothetical protein
MPTNGWQHPMAASLTPHPSDAHHPVDAVTWPIVQAEFLKALALKSQIRRAGWFN